MMSTILRPLAPILICVLAACPADDGEANTATTSDQGEEDARGYDAQVSDSGDSLDLDMVASDTHSEGGVPQDAAGGGDSQVADARTVDTTSLEDRSSGEDVGTDTSTIDMEFCPPYDDSSIYRARFQTKTVGPSDDWASAIQDAAPGTEVRLRDGTYTITGEMYAVQVPSQVTVRGDSGDRDSVLIQGEGYGVGSEGLMVVGSDVTIADLSMTGIRNHAISIKGEQGVEAPHIYNVHLYDIGTQHIKLTPDLANDGTSDGLVACSRLGYTDGGVEGDYINAIDLHNAIDWLIRDNVIYNLTGDGSGCEVDIDCGSYISGPAILVWNSSAGTIVERNRIYDSFRNIAFGLGSNHDRGIIRNNFIYRSGAGDAGIELRTATNVTVINNTVRTAEYQGAIEFQSGSSGLIANNLISSPVWDRGSSDMILMANIDDATDGDFVMADDPHLGEGSRAMGQGIAHESAPTDIDGDTRNGVNDVGCDQVAR